MPATAAAGSMLYVTPRQSAACLINAVYYYTPACLNWMGRVFLHLQGTIGYCWILKELRKAQFMLDLFNKRIMYLNGISSKWNL